MTWDLKKELWRKVVHLLSISFIVAYLALSHFFDEKIALLALSAMLIIGIELEYLRVELGYKIPFFSHFWKLRRKKEASRLGGEIFFLLGAIICFAAFDYRIAVAAILMTTFGDLAAALFGKRFGKHWVPMLKERAWEGVAAELAVDLLLGCALLAMFAVPNALLIAVVMALTATIVETAVNKLDDNLLIPIFAGFNGQIALMLLGGLL